jgi:CHAT domain-containing protein
MGWIYERFGDIDKALEYHEKALAIQIQNEEWNSEAYSLLNIGGIYKDQGNYTKAEQFINDGIQIGYQNEYSDVLANGYQSLGLLLLSKGEVQNALYMLEEAMAFAIEENNLVYQTWTNKYLGDAYFEMNEWEDAIVYYKNSIKMSNTQNIFYGSFDSYVGLSNTYLQKDDLDNAKKYALKAFEMSKEKNEPLALYACTELMRTISAFESDWEASDNYFKDILAFANKLMISNFATMSEDEKATYFDQISENFMNFYSYCLFRKDVNKDLIGIAYSNIMKHKGILLKSSTSMRNAVYNSGDVELIENYRKWIMYKNLIADKYSNGEDISELEEEANKIEKELVKSSQVFSSFNKISDYSWKDVQAALSSEEVAIEFINFSLMQYDKGEYLNFSDSVMYCAMIVTKDCENPIFVPMFYEHELEQVISQLGDETNRFIIDALYGNQRSLTYVNSQQQNINYSDKLYSLIWFPLEEYLQGIKTIYYAPAGVLHNISFSALPYSDSLFLSDKYQLHYCSSTAKLAYTEQSGIFDNENTGQWAYLYGGLDFDLKVSESDSTLNGKLANYKTSSRSLDIPEESRGLAWGYLPGTLSEIEGIGKVFEKQKMTYKLVKAEYGTEDYFKSVSSSMVIPVIHIATHGFYFPQNASTNKNNINSAADPMMRSGLILAGGNTTWKGEKLEDGIGDGILTAYEVSCLDLNKTELVVLSACETGLGDIKGSEGVYGLQRAFKMAGVNYIIMSLWKVADKETAEFMTLFYESLVEIKDVQKAFIHAQKIMRKNYSPYYWAAFVLVE